MVITVRAVKTKWVEWDYESLKPSERTKNYTSGMVQTWNKFCFTGGVLQMSIRLPGKHDSGGADASPIVIVQTLHDLRVVQINA